MQRLYDFIQFTAPVAYSRIDPKGVVVPHVNTKAEAEVVAAACKFKTKEFPNGRRGMWVSRQGYGVQDYFMNANATTMCVILIEDIEAVRNLDEILTVDGIDVFAIAFADLAQSMGCVYHLYHTNPPPPPFKTRTDVVLLIALHSQVPP